MLKFVHTFRNIVFWCNIILEPEIKQIIFNNSLSTSKKRKCVVIAKINQLLLFRGKKLLFITKIVCDTKISFVGETSICLLLKQATRILQSLFLKLLITFKLVSKIVEIFRKPSTQTRLVIYITHFFFICNFFLVVIFFDTIQYKNI